MLHAKDALSQDQLCISMVRSNLAVVTKYFKDLGGERGRHELGQAAE